jgi:hypothetical protein
LPALARGHQMRRLDGWLLLAPSRCRLRLSVRRLRHRIWCPFLLRLSQIAYRTFAVLYGDELWQESVVVSAGGRILLLQFARRTDGVRTQLVDKISKHMIRVPGSTHASGALDGCRSHEKSSHFLQHADRRGPPSSFERAVRLLKSDSLSEAFTGLCNRIVIQCCSSVRPAPGAAAYRRARLRALFSWLAPPRQSSLKHPKPMMNGNDDRPHLVAI